MDISFLFAGKLYLFIPFFFIFAAGFLCKFLLNKNFFHFFRFKKWSKKEIFLRPILLFFSMSFLLFSLAGPVCRFELRGYNYLVLLDVTHSMLCLDYEQNGVKIDRLEIARMNLLNLLDELPAGSRLGIALAAGGNRGVVGLSHYNDLWDSPVEGSVPKNNYPDINTEYGYGEIMANSNLRELVLPLALPQDVKGSYAELRQIISSIGPWMTWSGGSSPRSSLIRAGEIISGFGKQLYGDDLVIIFLTDGEDAPGYISYYYNKDFSLDDIKGTELGEAKIFVGGLGTKNGGPVPIYNAEMEIEGYTKLGNDLIISSINEETMAGLANKFKGRYKRIKDKTDLNFLAHDDSFKIAKQNASVPVDWMFSLAAALLLLIYAIL